MADKEDYNPYEHRNVDSPISNCGAFLSILKSVIGTGILALPLAFHYAGIVNAIILIIVVTYMLIHGIKLLIYSMVECSRRMQVGYASFPQSMAYAFRQGPDCFRYCARAGSYFVNAVLALSHYGICEVYIVFVATNIKQVIDFYGDDVDVRYYVVFVGVLTIPPFLIRPLRWLVPFNLVANILIYSGLFVMCHYLFRDLPSLYERCIVFGDVKNMGLFFGTVLFSVSSVGVKLAIEAKMAHPQDLLGWFGILDWTIFVVGLTYVFFGFFGYWRYGDQAASSISLNLPNNEVIAQVSRILIAIAVFLTYPLSGYVVVDIIMNHCWNRSGTMTNAKPKESIVRIVFVLLTTLNGVLVPNLAPLLSLVGAFSISMLNLIFPAVMEICLYYPPAYSYGRCRWRLWKDITLVFVGFIILIEGTLFSIVTMVEEYGGGSSKTKATDTEIFVDNTHFGRTGATTALAVTTADSSLRFS